MIRRYPCEGLKREHFSGKNFMCKGQGVGMDAKGQKRGHVARVQGKSGKV